MRSTLTLYALALVLAGGSAHAAGTEIADVLSDDLADFYGHLTNTDYRLVSYRHPTAAEIRQHPELGRRGGVLLFPTGRFA